MATAQENVTLRWHIESPSQSGSSLATFATLSASPSPRRLPDGFPSGIPVGSRQLLAGGGKRPAQPSRTPRGRDGGSRDEAASSKRRKAYF